MFVAPAGEICRITGGRLLAGDPQRVARGISTDTRTLEKDMAFIALRGSRWDGHDFIPVAVDKGAAAVLGEDFKPEIRDRGKDTALIQVGDTLRALGQLAAHHRWKNFQGVMVAVTGSSGKTTTKNLVAAVLSLRYSTLKSPSSFNNEIGLPLTLLSLEPHHQAAVVEMAMRGLGEIAYLCSLARPQVGVITNIGTAHLGRLGSLENIAKAKGELIHSLPPEGWAILNGDDLRCRQLALEAPCPAILFGQNPECQVRVEGIKNKGLAGVEATVSFSGERIGVLLPVPGLHNVYNALAALAVGWVLGIPPKAMADAFNPWPQEALRQEFRPGPRGCLVFNDSYNANPDSMRAALDTLASLPGQRKMAVLGQMAELGEAAPSYHRDIGFYAARRGLHRLILLGPYGEDMAAGALQGGMDPGEVKVCRYREEALQYLKDVKQGDVVLFKGSRQAEVDRVLALWEAERDDL